MPGVSNFLYRHCILLGRRNELLTRRNASRIPSGGFVLCYSFAVYLRPPMTALDGIRTCTLYVSPPRETASDKTKCIKNPMWGVHVVLFPYCVSPGVDHNHGDT